MFLPKEAEKVSAHERTRRATAGNGKADLPGLVMEAPASEAERASVSLAWNRLMRLDRRRRLRAALTGSASDRWLYALGRALRPAQEELILYGETRVDNRKAARLALRTFWRLEIWAAIWTGEH